MRGRGWGGIPELVGDGDEIQFLILVRVTYKYTRIGYENDESKTRLHSTPLSLLTDWLLTREKGKRDGGLVSLNIYFRDLNLWNTEEMERNITFF